MFDAPFTPGMREVFKLTKSEAVRLGSNVIYPDHHALAILSKGDGMGFETLEELSVDIQQLRSFIESHLSLRAIPSAGQPTLAPESRILIEHTAMVAKTLGHGWVGSEHLLIALAETTATALSKYLLGKGIRVEDVRAAVDRVITGTSRKFAIYLQLSDAKQPKGHDPLERVIDQLMESYSPDEREALRQRFESPENIFEHLKQSLPAWELATAISKSLSMPFIVLQNCEISQETLAAMPLQYVRQHRIMPVDLQGEILSVAISNPALLKHQAEFEAVSGKKVVLVMCFESDIQAAISQYYPE